MSDQSMTLLGQTTTISYDAPKNATFDQWYEDGKKLQGASASLAFWFGDWFIYGERHFSKDDMYMQAIEETGNRTKTFQNWISLCKGIPEEDRVPGLSFNAHSLVTKIKDVGDRKAILRAVREHGASPAALKSAVTEYVKKQHPKTKSRTPGKKSNDSKEPEIIEPEIIDPKNVPDTVAPAAEGLTIPHEVKGLDLADIVLHIKDNLSDPAEYKADEKLGVTAKELFDAIRKLNNIYMSVWPHSQQQPVPNKPTAKQIAISVDQTPIPTFGGETPAEAGPAPGNAPDADANPFADVDIPPQYDRTNKSAADVAEAAVAKTNSPA